MSSYMQKTAAANRLRKLAAASRVVRKYRRIEKIAGTTGALIGAGAGAGLGAGGGYLLARALNAKNPYIWALGGGGVGALGGAGIGALLGNKKTDSGKAPSKGTSPSKSSPAVFPKEKKTRAPGGNSGSYNGRGPITLAPGSHVIPSEQRKKYTGPSEVEFASSELANPEEPDQQSEQRKKYLADIDSLIDMSEKMDQQAERRKKRLEKAKERLEENRRYAAWEQMRMLTGVDEGIPKSIILRARESERRYPEHNDPAFPNAAHILGLWPKLHCRWDE